MENIEKIRYEMQQHLGKKVMIKAHLGRKKYMQFEAVVCAVYSNVFTVEPLEALLSNTATLTYSYSDVLIKNIQIHSVLAG